MGIAHPPAIGCPSTNKENAVKKSRHMRMGWGLALAATLVAVWFAPAPQDDSVALTSRVARIQPPIHPQGISAAMMSPKDSGVSTVVPKSSEKSVAPVQVLRIRDRSYSENEELSIFGKAAWERSSGAANASPTELVPPQALPVSRTAPALPFRVMGRYEDSGKSVVFLLQADQSWVVREGDTFAETYKVERIASNAIHLRYLPLNEVQVLEMGVAP